MKLDEVKNVMKNVHKGTNIIMEWNRTCKTKKSCQDNISKKVRAIGRLGIDYNNQKSVQEKRANGELPEQEQPIWNGKGQWDIFPFLIRHVNTEQRYLRLYKGTSNKVKPNVQFFRNGEQVTFENVENDLLSSEKNKEKGDCFCCKIENLTAIYWETQFQRESKKEKEEDVKENVTTP